MGTEPQQPIRYFGDYVLLGQIARGGMGEVWFANQASLHRSVAIKLIRSDYLGTSAEVQRFRLEAEAAGRLNHPNIVRIFEVGEHDGRHFFSMELFEEGSLADQLKGGQWRMDRANAQARQSAAARLVATLADAVHHAHVRGVIHRDVKPANVLMDAQGTPHLSDFGLAKLYDSEGVPSMTRAIQGTPGYLAPEAAAGGQILLTTAADVYSLGAVLFELLTGQPPFGGDNPLAVLKQVIETDPPAPSQLQPLVERDLEVISLKCLEKHPALRYPTARDLQLDLHRWLRGEPIEARSPSGWERLVKWRRRHPALAAMSVVTVTVLLGGLGATTWQWRQAERERHRVTMAYERLELQRAESLFEAGHARRAIATLASALRANPRNRAAQERLVHALNERSFLLPALGPDLPGPQPAVNILNLRVAAAPTGATTAMVATATNENALELTLWNSTTGQRLRTWTNLHSHLIRSVEWAPTGQRLVSASADGTAVIWSPSGDRPLATLPHGAPLHHAAFSPANDWVVTAGADHHALLWNLRLPESPVAPPLVHPHAVNTARFAPSGTAIVTTCDDESVYLWQTNGVSLAVPYRFPVQPTDARFSDDERSISVRFGDGSGVRLRRTYPVPPAPNRAQEMAGPKPRALTAIPGLPTGLHRGDIVGTNQSSDGRWIATASVDQTARIWQSGTFQPVSEPLVHPRPVHTAVFSPDGRRLATATAREHRLWDVATGQPLCDWRPGAGPRGLVSIEFGWDGSETITSDGQVWPVHVANGPAPAWLIDLAEILGQERTVEGVSNSIPGNGDVWRSRLSELEQKKNLDRLSAWARYWWQGP